MFRHSCETHGHRYKPRYDVVAPAWMNSPQKWTAEGFGGAREFYEKRYVCDICERCGQIVDGRVQLQTGLGSVVSQAFGAGL